jgi:hypothetical protein
MPLKPSNKFEGFFCFKFIEKSKVGILKSKEKNEIKDMKLILKTDE